MPVYPITSQITLNKPASELFNLVTTVKNYKGLHPATKDIVGPYSINNPAFIGMRFQEIVETPGLEGFVCEWEVRNLVKDRYFELVFPLGFGNGPLNQLVITYDIVPLREDKCHFTRNFISFCRPGVGEVETQVLREPDSHEQYLKNVKARLGA